MSRTGRVSTQSHQHPLTLKLQQNVHQHALLVGKADRQRTTVVVGVSGGADSVSLLHALVTLRAPLLLDIHVAHVDHGLRRDSHNDADLVRRLSHDWECPFHHVVLQPENLHGQPGGLEAAARMARYAFLCQVAYNVTPADQVPTIAVAHNAGDQAETLLFHLVRGSGLHGLAAMRWKSEIDGTHFDPVAGRRRPLNLIRPFLNIDRHEIEAYLHEHGLPWHKDVTNESELFARNYMRREIIPRLERVNPQVVDSLGRAAALIADEADRLDRLDRELLAALTTSTARAMGTPRGLSESAGKRLLLDMERMQSYSRADQRGVLRAAIANVANGLADITFQHIEQILDRLQESDVASGPHPIARGICWSVVASLSDRPTYLSIHRADALPIAAPGPQVDGMDSSSVRLPLDRISVEGWRLTTELLSPSNLPADWQTLDPWHAWLDADRIQTLCLTTPRHGMRVAPLGMDGHSKSIGDLFTDSKIHPALRARWPVIVEEESGDVVWICGLCLAHSVRITDRSTRVLHLGWQPVDGTPIQQYSPDHRGERAQKTR